MNDASFPEVVFECNDEAKLIHPFIDEYLGFVDLTAIKKKYKSNDRKELKWVSLAF